LGDNFLIVRLERALLFVVSVVVAVAVWSANALCQNPLDYVPNLPYTAQIVQRFSETLPNGSQVLLERRIVQMRDSQGRTRIENFPPHDPSYNDERNQSDVVNLYVPLQREFIQLFPRRKTASVMTFPGKGPIRTHGDPNDTNIERQSLPGRTIHGIYSEGTRVTFLVPHNDGRATEVGCVEESWVSPEMKIVVLTKSGGTCSDGGITEIRGINRNEPDPALFEIPKDYKVVTATDAAATAPP
jgi:hypothetical protein